jgi:phospholipid/cholesterol/gamma-HCH transport system substrate-binding protein
MSGTFRLGVFIVVTLVAFGAGIFWIGQMRFLFNSTYRLNAEFDNVAGLNDGAEVRVAGIHEGTVTRIQLPQHSQEKVRVVMDMRRDTKQVIKRDSVAAIRSEGLIGDKYVEISVGSEEAARVANGDTVGSEPPIQLSDLVKKADGILDSARDAVGNVTDTTKKIDEGRGTIGALVNDRGMYEHANAAAIAAQDDMEAAKHNFLLRGFFNKRGYEDPSDLKKHEVANLPARTPVKQFTYEGQQLFEKRNVAKLKKSKQLEEAGSYLESNPFGVAVIAAHVDPRGDSDKNQVVAEARAKALRDYLVQNFKLEDVRIKTIAFGKSRDDGSDGKIEVLVYPVGTPVPNSASP